MNAKNCMVFFFTELGFFADLALAMVKIIKQIQPVQLQSMIIIFFFFMSVTRASVIVILIHAIIFHWIIFRLLEATTKKRYEKRRTYLFVQSRDLWSNKQFGASLNTFNRRIETYKYSYECN